MTQQPNMGLKHHRKFCETQLLHEPVLVLLEPLVTVVCVVSQFCQQDFRAFKA
jgi:hypothetical protein